MQRSTTQRGQATSSRTQTPTFCRCKLWNSVVKMVVMKGTIVQIGTMILTMQMTIFILSGLIASAAAANGGEDGDEVGAADWRRPGRRIDVHGHFVPPFYRDILLQRNLTSGGAAIPVWNASYHVEEQAKFNVKTSILSISVPSVVFFEPHEVAERRELARRLNEFGRNVSMEYPGRLQFFATLTLPDVEGAVDEAIYSLDVLKAAGVILLGNSNGVYLGNPDFDPLMEVLNDRSAVVFVHPNALYQERDIGIAGVALDFLLDTSRAAWNLVLKNVTGRYPKIKWILAHSGGFIPFAAGRLSLFYSQVLQNTTREDILQRLKTFYVEIGYTGASQLPSVLDFVPEEKVIFGSDWPMQIEGLSYVSSILDAFPLTVQQRDDINFGNAAALFGGPLS